MKKEIFKKYLIEKVLPIDWALAENENFLSNIDPELKVKVLDVIENKYKEQNDYYTKKLFDERRKILLYEIKYAYALLDEEENEDKNGLYVAVSSLNSKDMFYRNIETGMLTQVIRNVKSDNIIYPENYLEITEEQKSQVPIVKKFLEEADNIRYDYYCEAIRSDFETAKEKILNKYKKDR